MTTGHGRTKSTDNAFGGPTEKFTRAKLLDLRKKEFIPDISYDLDGDGFVGGRDYVIGRRFDEGLKNYLTPEERKKAIEAVKNVSSNFNFITPFLFRVTKTNLFGTLKPRGLSVSSVSCKREGRW